MAIDVARVHGAVLVPVHVQCPIESRSGTGAQAGVGLEVSDRRSLLTQAQAQGASDLLVEPEVVTGHAAAVLLEMTRPGDVLVVGSRGRGGFRGLLMGSTSTQCAQHATCPVVVVPDSSVMADSIGAWTRPGSRMPTNDSRRRPQGVTRESRSERCH